MTVAARKTQWWMVEEGESVYKHIWAAILYYNENQNHISLANLEWMKLYQNTNIPGFAGRDYSRVTTGSNSPTDMTYNLVKSAADTVRAKICKNRPRAMFLTEDGDFSEQRRAKVLSQFVAGVFYEGKAYETTSMSFLDGAVFGTGLAKTYIREEKEYSKIVVERIFPEEIIVDEMEGRYGNPRQIFQQKHIDRYQLIQDYPEMEANLEVTKRANEKSIMGSAENGDQLLVIEAWRLPSGPDATDGKHAIIVENGTLLHEDYTRDRFPFSKIIWNPNLLGYFGHGLAQELRRIQQEINKTAKRIQAAQHRIARPTIYVERGSKIVKAHLRNAVADVVEYTGTPPVTDTPQAVNPEMYAYLEYMWQKGFEIAGISQLSAGGKKPAGIDSAVAMREYQDIETERFSQVALGYDDFILDISAQIVHCAREAYEKDNNFAIRFAGKDFIKTIKWSDVNMAEDQYIMKIEGTSSLPKTPAGRTAMAMDLRGMGLIDEKEALSLIDYQDTDSVVGLKLAGYDDIKATIEELLDGKYTPPSPLQDLESGKVMVHLAMLKAKRSGAPERITELGIRWVEEARAELGKAAAAMVPPPPPQLPPGPPGSEGLPPALPPGGPPPPV